MQFTSIVAASLIASIAGLVQGAPATSPVAAPAAPVFSSGKNLVLCFNKFGGGGIYLRSGCKPGDEGTVFTTKSVTPKGATAAVDVVAVEVGATQTLKLAWDKDNGHLVASNGAETYNPCLKSDLKKVCIRYQHDNSYDVFRAVDNRCAQANSTLFELDNLTFVKKL